MASIYHRAVVWTGSASALILTGQGLLFGLQLGTDGVNDPTITIYDSLAATGKEVIPTAEYEADYKGLNGVIMSYGKQCDIGIYIEISGSGTVEVAVDYRSLV
jgi:hypothetical protein